MILLLPRYRRIKASFVELPLGNSGSKSRFATQNGTMYYEVGQHYMTQTTEEQSERQKAAAAQTGVEKSSV
jgi:hypothetical protein